MCIVTLNSPLLTAACVHLQALTQYIHTLQSLSSPLSCLPAVGRQSNVDVLLERGDAVQAVEVLATIWHGLPGTQPLDVCQGEISGKDALQHDAAVSTSASLSASSVNPIGQLRVLTLLELLPSQACSR